MTGWLGNRGRAYSLVLTALALNLPFILGALARYPDPATWMGIIVPLYAATSFVGYYVFGVLGLLTCLFILLGTWRRGFLSASATLLTLILFFLVVDGVVYRMLRTHIDGFWIEYVFTTFAGLGIPTWALFAGPMLLISLVALEWGLFRLARRIQRRRRVAVGVVGACVISFVTSQVIHIAAYEADDTRITSITPQLPFYFPVTSHKNAVKYGSLVAAFEEADHAGGDRSPVSLHYPLRDVSCVIPAGRRRPNILVLLLESWRADAMDSVTTPNLHAISGRSSSFVNHFSSGNATPPGVFPLFYGIHSTYWAAVKANARTIDNPVFIDALQANGYGFGIYAKSHFDRHKISSTVFRGIEVHESFEGRTADLRDREMTDSLFKFMMAEHRQQRPFVGFAFYKSTHFPYAYPAGSGIFQPALELDVLRASGERDPERVVADYRNSVHYVDELVGSLLERMQEAGLLDNTIIVITGDHGEEFDDNGAGYWGHTGNFTRYQTQVPLLLYVPWRQPRRIEEVTSHVDVAPTLLREGLGCTEPIGRYSNGLDLFGPLPERRAVVVSSYVNHAVIMDGDVFSVFPMYVARYTLDDVNGTVAPPDPDLMKEALDEMRHFYQPRPPRVSGASRRLRQ